MKSPTSSLAISDIYARTIATGKMTYGHRRFLMEAISSSMLLDDEERSAIDRLLWSARQGHFELVD